jgi:hypothetical protein
MHGVCPPPSALAYSTILLRLDGYPCLFYTDYSSAEYGDLGRGG